MLMWFNIGIAVFAFMRALILKIVNRKESMATDATKLPPEDDIDIKPVISAADESADAKESSATNTDDNRTRSAACG